MNIISLDPFLTETLFALGVGEHVVGVTDRCDYPEAVSGIARVVDKTGLRWDLMRELAPTHVFGAVWTVPEDEAAALKNFESKCHSELGPDVTAVGFSVRTLEGVYAAISALGIAVGAGARGRELGARAKAQLMDWCDNFYDRMKNKKVTFLRSIAPLQLGGLWIPEMIRLASAQSQEPVRGLPGATVAWDTIVAYRPDVIVVAPETLSLKESLRTFAVLEKFPAWETLPAVKRGEVIFADGRHHFSRPSSRIISSMAILVSAIAGLESGYITERDSFFRLRWLELHRHAL